MKFERSPQFGESTEPAEAVFNTQMAEQLAQLKTTQLHESTAKTTEQSIEERSVSPEHSEDTIDFDPHTVEGLQLLRETLQAYVEQAESYHAEAASTGYTGIAYHGLVAEECFTELQDTLRTVDDLLHQHETVLLANPETQMSDEVYSEIQWRTSFITELSHTIVHAVTNNELLATEASEQVPAQVEGLQSQLQSIVTDTNAFYQVASSWFPPADRSEAVHEYLNGLQADVKRATELLQRQTIDDIEEYQEFVQELENSVSAYESHLRTLHEQKRSGAVDVTGPGDVSEPLILTPEQRVNNQETVDDIDSLLTKADELVWRVDSSPYISTSERQTIKFAYDAFVQAATAESLSVEKVNQKFENLGVFIEGVIDQPGADALKERVNRVLDSLKDKQFHTDEDRQTAAAMCENFLRQYYDDTSSEETLQAVYQSIESFIAESTNQVPELFGVALPEAGESSVPEVRALRRKLIGVADSMREELTKSQRIDTERLIKVLEYAVHDTLTEVQAEQVSVLAARIEAREPVLPYDEKQFTAPAEDSEDDAVPVPAKTGKVRFGTDFEEAESVVPVVANTNTHTKAAAEQPSTEISDLTELGPDLHDGGSDSVWDDAVEAVEHTEPVPVVSEPVSADLPEADKAALSVAEEADPVNEAVPEISHARLQSYEERALRAKKTSLAARVITGEVAQKLQERSIPPSEIDRKVTSFVGAFERKYISQFDKWLGENTKSAYAAFATTPVHEFMQLSQEFSAANRDQFQKEYDIKYEVLVAWQDLLQGEIAEVVGDIGALPSSTTLAEAMTKYIAVLETQ